MTATLDSCRKLYLAMRDARIKTVIDLKLIKNDAEADLLTALVKDYGDPLAGFIDYSPRRARAQNARRILEAWEKIHPYGRKIFRPEYSEGRTDDQPPKTPPPFHPPEGIRLHPTRRVFRHPRHP